MTEIKPEVHAIRLKYRKACGGIVDGPRQAEKRGVSSTRTAHGLNRLLNSGAPTQIEAARDHITMLQRNFRERSSGEAGQILTRLGAIRGKDYLG